MSNRKGSFILSKESVLFFFYVFFLVVVVVSFKVALAHDASGILKAEKLHERIFANNIYYNECFLLKDERVHYGVIDLSKLNNENFGKCMKQGKYALRFNLFYENEIKTFTFNDELLNSEIFCNIKKKNLLCNNYTYYVNVYDNGEIKEGKANLWLVGVQNE